VSFDVHAGGKNAGVALEEDHGNIAPRFNLREHFVQLTCHPQVDDIKRRIDELDVGNRRRDFCLDAACGGGGHLRSMSKD